MSPASTSDPDHIEKARAIADAQASARHGVGASYQDSLVAEAESWLMKDAGPRAHQEKLQRERIRHHKLIRDLLLHCLDTREMAVLEVGGGPLPLSDLLDYRFRSVIDPLTPSYKTMFDCPDHVEMFAEDLRAVGAYDLVVCTNALDHVNNPKLATERIADALRPGGYFAVMCAENNAITNPHPAHQHNLTADHLHRWLDKDFETVWELDYANDGYRYGWVLHQGRRGQPAFALLMRKCSGYDS